MKDNCVIIGLTLLLASSSYEYTCDKTPKKAAPPKPNDKYIIEIQGNPSRYSPGKFYEISLKSKPSSPVTNYFHEFILVVEPYNASQDVNTGRLITTDPTITKFTPKCRNAIVEWNKVVRKSHVEIKWQAPPSGNGCVAITAAVFESKESWYIDDGGLTKVLCEEEENIDEQGPYLEECLACDEAKYEIAFQGMWTRNTHPKNYPNNMWETKIGELIGASHANDKSFWEYNSIASEELKLLAETGNTFLLENKLKDLVKTEDVRTIIQARELSYPNITGTTYTVFRVDKKHHLISLVAKITPSPDWIVGVANLELCTPDKKWIRSRTLNLYPWDVGTDNGTSYNSTVPVDSYLEIQPITGEMEEYPFYNKDGLKPIAQLRVTRQKLYKKNCTEEESCEYTPWSKWSSCSTTCGHEFRTRDRQLAKPENQDKCVKNNGPLELQQNEECDQDPACEPSECANATWTEWSPCNVTCGEGSKTRQGLLPDTENSEESPSCEETVTCWMPDCKETEEFSTTEASDEPVDCELSEWSEWGPCRDAAPCSRGYQYSERHVEVEARNGGMPCPKKRRKSRRCKVPCVGEVIDCKLGEWSNWSPCSSSCGSFAVQQRTRPLLQPPSNGGKPCGHRVERKRCMLPYACGDRELLNMIE